VLVVVGTGAAVVVGVEVGFGVTTVVLVVEVVGRTMVLKVVAGALVTTGAVVLELVTAGGGVPADPDFQTAGPGMV
jgi:hypothetical protein